jgi:hypothetical protein
MRSIIIFIIAIASILTSCKKFLDVKPKGRLIPNEVEEFNHLLDNEETVISFFLDNNLGSMIGYLTDNLELSENLAGIHYKAMVHPNIERYYAYTFRQPYKNPNLSDGFWNFGIYGAVKYYNNIIDGVMAIRNTQNAAECDVVLAQAYAARAWVYLNATMVYGPVYKPGESNSTQTIPYLVNSDISVPVPPPSTQNEMFSHIFNDLHQALPKAPQITSYPSRAGRTTVQAMLAYYHLFSRKFDSVAHYANLAWQSATANGGPQKVLYDYNQLSFKDPQNLLYSAIKSPDDKIQLPVSREILFFRSTDEQAGMMDDAYPSQELISLFDQANDLRYQFFFMNAPGYKTIYNNQLYDDGERIQYFRSGPTFGNTPKFQMTAGLSYPELLLMRAEGYARTNKLAEAIADLNTLRRNRFKTGTPDLTIPASQDQAIEMVLNERRRELPAGHLKRFLDLKRLSLDNGKGWTKTSITHKAGSTEFNGLIDSKDFILSIPNIVLRSNPGWGIPLDNRPY